MEKKMLTREEIIEKLRDNREILKKYGVKRIGMFGSYVRGEQKSGSDIDLVIEFDRSIFGKDFKGLFDAFMDASSYIETLFDKKIDILTPDSIKTIRNKEVAEEIERSIVYV